MKVKRSDPLSLLEARLRLVYPSSIVETILEGFAAVRNTTLRVNTLKTTTETFLQHAKEEHIVLIPVPWYPEAFIVQSPDLRTLTETSVYKNGLCYVQSLSSMLPSLILSPQKNEQILDLCAAPGSKTSHMAMLMENTGTITANDSSHTRIYRLKANMVNLGVTNTTVTRQVGQGLWHEYQEYFDKTLVDVPCSMEGRISLQKPESYEDWSVKKVKELQEIQKFLLKSAISATKPGGTIVYSTCTLSIEENESVIDWILKKAGEHIMLEDFDIAQVPWSPAIVETSMKQLNPEISKTKRILPSKEFEGFYIAKIRKTQSNF